MSNLENGDVCSFDKARRDVCVRLAACLVLLMVLLSREAGAADRVYEQLGPGWGVVKPLDTAMRGDLYFGTWGALEYRERQGGAYKTGRKVEAFAGLSPKSAWGAMLWANSAALPNGAGFEGAVGGEASFDFDKNAVDGEGLTCLEASGGNYLPLQVGGWWSTRNGADVLNGYYLSGTAFRFTRFSTVEGGPIIVWQQPRPGEHFKDTAFRTLAGNAAYATDPALTAKSFANGIRRAFVRNPFLVAKGAKSFFFNTFKSGLKGVAPAILGGIFGSVARSGGASDSQAEVVNTSTRTMLPIVLGGAKAAKDGLRALRATKGGVAGMRALIQGSKLAMKGAGRAGAWVVITELAGYALEKESELYEHIDTLEGSRTQFAAAPLARGQRRPDTAQIPLPAEEWYTAGGYWEGFKRFYSPW